MFLTFAPTAYNYRIYVEEDIPCISYTRSVVRDGGAGADFDNMLNPSTHRRKKFQSAL
jgi:hypothetical protein